MNAKVVDFRSMQPFEIDELPALEETVAHADEDANLSPPAADVSIYDFWSYMPTHQYMFVPSRELWPASSVNARCAGPKNEDGTAQTKRVRRTKKDKTEVDVDVPIKPTEYLDRARAVEQMTWAPGEELVIKGRLISNGGWIYRDGCAVFNLYMPPARIQGDASAAGPWVNHVRNVYPDSVDHIVKWLAHRVQRPGQKLNHALVLGGQQGIGKDTILEPIKHAIGPWNFHEVSPVHLLGRFNNFVKSVILRVSEARDLGDVDRFAFYDHLKVYTAAPPDVIRCDEKHLKEHSVLNVCGVIVTTNHKTDGIYLPADDRRHYVAWSDKSKEEFSTDYWPALYRWYADGGTGHVAAYLREFDLSEFDPKAPPPKTPAFWAIVDANRAPEDAQMADALEALGNPAALALAELQHHPSVDAAFREWLKDVRSRRQIPHRLEAAGYVAVRNDAAKDGLWKFNRARQCVYALKELSVRDRIVAATAVVTKAQQGSV